MQTITTTIERRWLADIVAKRKPIEYREIKPYWTKRLAAVEKPFLLRLINGMQPNAPEVTVEVTRVTKNSRLGSYELHLGRVRGVKNWDRRKEEPLIRRRKRAKA
jgi:hypothetical protein